MASYKFLRPELMVAASGWLSRGVIAVSQLLLMREMLDYLGVSDYALYAVFVSLYAWMALADVGVGTAYQNLLAARYGMGEAGELENSKLGGLLVLVLVVNVALWPIASTCLSLAVYGKSGFASNNLVVAATFCAIGQMTAIFSTVYKIFYAERRGYYANIFPAAASVLTVLLVYSVQAFALPNASLLSAILITYLPLLIVCVPIFFAKVGARASFDLTWCAALLKVSLRMMLFSLLSLITLGLDVLIVSLFLEANEVVEYNLVLRVSALAIFFYSAYLLAMMPITTQMMRQGQHVELWLRLRSGMGWAAIAGAIFFGAFGVTRGLVSELLTEGKVSIAAFGVFAFFAYFMMRVWVDTFAMALQSINRVNGLIVCVAVQALLSVACQLVFIDILGVYGAILGVIFSFAVTVAWFLPFQLRQQVRAEVEIP
ncbi:hypothetical protein Pstu01_29240 [Stutzerimonas stutzeri]|uniref:hypothetical protein n=1 Tax=Stutzerimonas stutzeri TaxID=316 RepID=UPI0024A09F19|nr:hypothetical protein [Stutzerimonas stutzeri]GLZ26255.1 hypothetical protein Pstu01_29240 [Stutzerimonas stutzeri]